MFKRNPRKGTGKPPASARPETIVGQLWRAAMLRHSAERIRLNEECKRTGSVAYIEYANAAFEIVIRRWFRAGVDLREISSLVQCFREAFGPTMPVLEAESLIRHALGEDVDISDIGLPDRIATYGFTLMGIADLINRDAAKVDEVLVEAEAEVRRRGLNPVMAE
ncbi:MAG TPA: hypothetical protein VF755_06960 [Catenuloplanes sp.]|jgi:hypothetical protein